MPNLSDKSKSKLYTCHEDLVRVVERAIVLVPNEYDFSVLCGHRTQEEQEDVFKKGYSKLRWARSKHNQVPSLAVDIVPYPIDWNDISKYYAIATYIFKAASKENVELRWGGHWTTFKDYPHWELVGG
ncbi:MAG: M15 family metallopeptidase [Burkholderiaceae bacterium]